MKNYIKPDIAFQSMSLSSNISTGCAVTANYEPEACEVAVPGVPGLTIFSQSSCGAYAPGYDDMVCYHVPFTDVNVFDS